MNPLTCRLGGSMRETVNETMVTPIHSGDPRSSGQNIHWLVKTGTDTVVAEHLNEVAGETSERRYSLLKWGILF